MIEEGGTGKDVVKFDVNIMDEQGVELVDIKEFTMLQVSKDVRGKIEAKEKEKEMEIDAGPAEKDVSRGNMLKNGILPSEGIDVFNRILDNMPRTLPQVVVSTTDLSVQLDRLRDSSPVFEPGAVEETKVSGPKYARPELSTVYVAPDDETEKNIAEIWQELLGIDKVGVHDDFFELGGDSLNIVQLNNKLKKALKKDIPVAVMFRYLTIHSFMEYLHGQEGGESNSKEKIDPSEERKRGKDRLKARISRR